MNKSIDYISRQQDDQTSYSETIEVAQKVLMGHGFDFTQSVDATTNNPTLLFNISGGVKYEQVLSGEEPAPDPAKIASVQRCIRADGFNKIGISGRHHIAFDMLGHFDFFEHNEQEAKEIALTPVHELLGSLGVENVFARHHPDDGISRRILSGMKVTLMEDLANVHVCNGQRRSGNRVEFGRIIDGKPTEIWNVVFTLYEGVDQSRRHLGRVAFDSGASVDRLVAAANKHSTDYASSHWQASISQIDERVPYHQVCRAVDFAKAAAVLTQSGVEPGPKKQGYIARKVFNELIRLENTHPLLNVETILESITLAQDLQADVYQLRRLYASEKARFERAITVGKKAVQARLKKAQGILECADYEFLKSTHGLDEETVNHILQTTQ